MIFPNFDLVYPGYLLTPVYLIVFGCLIYYTILWRKKSKKLSKNDRFMVISVFLLGIGLLVRSVSFLIPPAWTIRMEHKALWLSLFIDLMVEYFFFAAYLTYLLFWLHFYPEANTKKAKKIVTVAIGTSAFLIAAASITVAAVISEATLPYYVLQAVVRGVYGIWFTILGICYLTSYGRQPIPVANPISLSMIYIIVVYMLHEGYTMAMTALNIAYSGEGVDLQMYTLGWVAYFLVTELGCAVLIANTLRLLRKYHEQITSYVMNDIDAVVQNLLYDQESDSYSI
eukprot:TRINITY_DN1729_c0_g1_i1.p1 TRINITY_DN1729_c0_g1~~TRINITY_DN1729_c0_g1_i1.p1  ORF type:complete len:285 (+),score=15.04 TRINITY_DN1729_c0_g1_i1:27-881(+)